MTDETNDASTWPTLGTDAEFGFELRTCRWAELNWEPVDDRAVVVARQLGTKHRLWDTIVLECDREALRERARFGPDRLDGDLLHVVRNAPADWTYYRESLPEPDYPWRYVREAIHRGADRGILETRKRSGRIQIRRKWPYPDWLERVVAIENKPDVDASAARDLASQLEYDVAMGLADEVWVATRKTNEPVEPVLFEDLPVEAGILVFDPGTLAATVAWHPRTLPVEEPGTRILERPSGGDRDRSAARFESVSPETKATTRLEIAERAYERGWRSFVETMRPDCRYFELRARDQLLPWCVSKGRCQTAGECRGSCSEYEPEPPTWRTRGWPIEGGPGKRCRTLLETRRRRRRPGLSDSPDEAK
ncbi:DUF5787 family protein [Natrialbaceae archaeon AArc-T1-2]|uniref:DUF5787 family protein n=1 Tax=Natrialbaceae archaeon AArc-T1-2 TaxID=3053904 RepID=UPI00255A8A74|nr:DUF5787 family protein [Natrialbaceae archaeon AArc-T1-2]WIV68126.1 DUF5787 family protein [Natrialbaceae archaeon AArc-T1-2]